MLVDVNVKKYLEPHQASMMEKTSKTSPFLPILLIRDLRGLHQISILTLSKFEHILTANIVKKINNRFRDS